MKKIFLILLFASAIFGAQTKNAAQDLYLKPSFQLTSDAALLLMKKAEESAKTFNATVTMAVLDGAGNTISILRGNGVGPHNTEAARRKAFTALSTKTATLQLLRNAEKNPDSKNLNTLPELLLLSGGAPLYYKGEVIGSIGIAGGGSAENDDIIAKAATIPEAGITTTK